MPFQEPIETTDTFQKLNRETAKIDWRTLEPQLEQGALVLVDTSLDLVKVAYCFAVDDKHQVEQWLKAGQLTRVDQHLAAPWHAANPQFWAVVVAPWVLLQQPAQ